MQRDRAKLFTVEQPQKAELGLADPRRISQHGLEHGLQFAGELEMSLSTSLVAVAGTGGDQTSTFPRFQYKAF